MQLILKKPVQLTADGPSVTALNFREEMVTGDMRGILVRQDMPWEDVMKIAARLTGQTDVVMNRLSIADGGEVVRLVGLFLNAGQETGPTP